MNPDRWARVDEILRGALDRPQEEQLAFISAACGEDEGLAREVAELLAADREASGFLDLSNAVRDVDRAGSELVSGELVGPYRLLQVLGRGGMATVYLAERADGAFSHSKQSAFVSAPATDFGWNSTFSPRSGSN